jgi:mono/diheme cytochrome c family protein
MNTPRRRSWWVALTLLLSGAMLVLLVGWLHVRGESDMPASPAVELPLATQVERGAYLARAGNCMGCHTQVGSASFAGGRGIATPFGTVTAPNITPDARTGIGAWTADDFWRAMHHGRSRDGRLLYSAFPYPNFTHVTREDSDALLAYLKSVPAVERPNEPHRLRFPFNTQAALAVWRTLYFRPASFDAEPGRSSEWNRGKYLVQGLAHCSACHSGRNALGGSGAGAAFAGSLMPDDNWYAPSLASPSEAGVQRWPRHEVVQLLKQGVTRAASVSGPMAEVVLSSTQHLSERDLGAMAQYLADIPTREPRAPSHQRADAGVMARGGKLYSQHCSACHGDMGQGEGNRYPPLAGNRAVTLAKPNNLLLMIRHGGFAPSTAGNPRPFGMPPYGQMLDDQEIAALATFIRQSWGNAASPVQPLDVLHVR